MTESDGAITSKKYKVQWQCAALFAIDMLVNRDSEIVAITCEDNDDFELDLSNGRKIVIQVTHSDSKNSFRKKDKKIVKSLENFKQVLMKGLEIQNFYFISNITITGNNDDNVKLKELLSDKDVRYYKSKLDCDDRIMSELLDKTIVKRLELDFLEGAILNKLGEKYGSEYPILQEIARTILDAIRESSTAATTKEIQYNKITNLNPEEEIRELKVNKEISKKRLEKIVNEILLKNTKKVQHSLLENGLLFLKEQESNSDVFEEWKKGFDLDLNGIRLQMEYKREDVMLDLIKKVELSANKTILIAGKSGASKSTLLMEMMWHYFDLGYLVLFNLGDLEIRNIPLLITELERVLGMNKNIAIFIDNVQSRKTLGIFTIINHFKGNHDILFFLTSRIPDFDRFMESINEDLISKNDIGLLYTLNNSRYPLSNFSVEDIHGFIKKYQNERSVNDIIEQYGKNTISVNEIARIIHDKTDGDPIMVKFFLFHQGFLEDVKDRFHRYLVTSEDKILTMLICCLLDISEIRIEKDILENLGLTKFAFQLTDETITIRDGIWKTIHPKWDLELIVFYLSTMDQYLLNERKSLFKRAVKLLFSTLDIKDFKRVINSLYDASTIRCEADRLLSIEFLDEVIIQDKSIFDSFSNEDKFAIYIYYASLNHILLNRYETAKQYCEIVTQTDPNFIDAWINKGTALTMLNRSEEALQCYEKVLEIVDENNNQFITALNNKGLLLQKLGRPEEAIECFERALRNNPYDINFLLGIAKSYNDLKLPDKALEYYDIGFKNINQNNVKNYDSNSILFTKFGELINYDFTLTNLAILHYNKGFSFQLKDDYNNARLHYNEALKINPQYVEAQINLSLLDANDRQFTDAFRHLDAALKIQNVRFYPQIFFNKGTMYQSQKKYIEALNSYDIALSYDQFKLSALFNKGLILKIYNEYRSSLSCFETVHNIDPNNTDCISELFWCHSKLENYYRIIPLGILLLGTNHENQQVWFGLIYALMQLGFFQSALNCIEKIITKTFANQETWFLKGLLFGSVLNYIQELVCYFIANVIEPNHKRTNLNTILCLINLGRYDEAIHSNSEFRNLSNFSGSFHEITNQQILTISNFNKISHKNKELLNQVNAASITNIFQDRYPNFTQPKLIAFLLISILGQMEN